jgi:HNH endonuclease
MPFPRAVRDEALVKSHRRCCVCHEFGGRSVNVHHIHQEADGGANTIENAICLCLRCHAEAGHFNPRHPMGTKYSPDELRAHRDQWWQHCAKHPEEPFQPTLDVSYKSILRSAELHRYHLLITYTNQFKEAQAGWKVQVFIPAFVPVDSMECDRYEKSINGTRYNVFEHESSEKVYPGETVEVIPSMNVFYIEYQMNQQVFMHLHQSPCMLWRFFATSAPPVEGERLLAELQEF